jgi:hypothetical protein
VGCGGSVLGGALAEAWQGGLGWVGAEHERAELWTALVLGAGLVGEQEEDGREEEEL